MGRFEPIAPSRMDSSQRELYGSILASPRDRSRVLTDDGRLKGPFDPMLRSPSVGLPLQSLGAALRYSTGLAPAHRELVIMVTAAEWRCDHEWAAHLPLAVAAGLDRAQLELLHDGEARFDEPVLDLLKNSVHEVLRNQTMSDITFSQLKEVLGEAQLFELLVLMGYYSALAVITNCLDIR